MIQIKSNKIRWFVSAVLALLILFGTFHSIFSLAAFALCVLMIVFVEREFILLQLFFIMPMANIFKMSPGTQSFFTILLLAYVVINLVLPRKATLLVVLFALYVLIGELIADQFNLFRTIKLICNLLFLSSVLNTKVQFRHKDFFITFIIGNIVASVFGMLDSSVFKIKSFVGEIEVGGNIGENIVRFSGLYTDPNYYAVGLVICLCLLVILFSRNEMKTHWLVLLAVPIVYFLIQTYSKSALIMLILPFVCLLYSLYKRKSYLVIIVFALASIAIIYLALNGRIEALNIVLARIEQSETSTGTTDINTLTTGRFDLWVTYFKYIINHFKTALFGAGITAPLLNDSASHNTYLDIIYHLGVVGGSLLIFLLAVISGQSRTVKINRNPINYSVMLCILIMYFFLGQLFYFDPPFHIFLAFTALNLPKEEEKCLN